MTTQTVKIERWRQQIERAMRLLPKYRYWLRSRLYDLNFQCAALLACEVLPEIDTVWMINPCYVATWKPVRYTDLITIEHDGSWQGMATALLEAVCDAVEAHRKETE